MRIPRPFYALIAAGALLFTTQTAEAVLTLTIDDGVNPVFTAEDQGANDLSPVEGAIVTTGNIGVWSFFLATGQTKPLIGDAQNPILVLDTSATSSAAGALTVMLSDIDYDPVAGDFTAFFDFSSTFSGTGQTVEVEFWLSENNILFDQGTLIGGFGPIAGPASFGLDDSNALLGISGPFSLTTIVTITHSQAATSNPDATIAIPSRDVPTPGTLPLFLAGLVALGFGMYSARRRRATAA
jgi:hypothetical protein